ncbi:MBL fold metallo-hydrolase [Candidatus Marsarchaeota archaeon]|nr:MBL fold metallo-hydrolase [Candidatus Marsarchaeota archaeon]
MDGMARKATDITLEFYKYLNNVELLRDAVKNIQRVKDRRDRIGALDGGNIILTPAGMLNGGPVLNYITKLRKNSKIFLTGYQAEATNGRMILEEGKVEVDEKIYRIPYPVLKYDFSAHAGRDDILEYIRKSNPEKVICVHGDAENSTSIATELKEEGFEAFAPEIGDRLEFEF